MAAGLIPSGPASALATEPSDRFAAMIIGGSACTRSVCTVMASVVPSAVLIDPRTAGMVTVVSRNASACVLSAGPSIACSCTSLPPTRESTNPMHSMVTRSRRAGLPRAAVARRGAARAGPGSASLRSACFAPPGRLYPPTSLVAQSRVLCFLAPPGGWIRRSASLRLRGAWTRRLPSSLVPPRPPPLAPSWSSRRRPPLARRRAAGGAGPGRGRAARAGGAGGRPPARGPGRPPGPSPWLPLTERTQARAALLVRSSAGR